MNTTIYLNYINQLSDNMESLNIQEKQNHEIAKAAMEKYGDVYFFTAEELNELVAKVNEIIEGKANSDDFYSNVEIDDFVSGLENEIDLLAIEFAESISDLNDRKLNKPDTDGTTTNFPYVVGVKTTGESTRLPAGDLGKNIANSDLTVTGARALDTDNNPFSIKNLPDKSADATFTDFVGKNASGQLAKVGYQAFKAQANSWTDTQKNEFAQILNGGFSTGTMSVNLISPPVFQQEDNNVYLVLRGTGLNLHPTERKIEILRASDNVVLAEIPNSQIQTYISGIELVFYYNFNSLGAGNYKLRITNGVNQYITSLNFKIVSEVENIDLSDNTFEIITDYENTKSFATNDAIVYDSETLVSTTTPIFSAKSSPLFAVGEDWYLEIQVNVSHPNNNGTAAQSMVGIGYSSSTHQLAYSQLNYLSIYNKFVSSSRWYKKLKAGGEDIINPTYEEIVSFVKIGNLITATCGGLTHTETVSNNSGYSLLLQIPGRNMTENFTVQILKAFKIIN